MKKIKLTKVIASSLIVASVLALNPISASASSSWKSGSHWVNTNVNNWKSDSVGWWYTYADSYAKGWWKINGTWYYFNSDGYMAHDTVIDGYKLGSDGACIPQEIITSGNFKFDKVTGILVKYIGTDTNVIIPSMIDGVSVTSIGDEAFVRGDVSFATSMTMSTSNVESITIPNSVTSIGDYAFNSCVDLESITIPNSVTRIGKDIFKRCDSLEIVNIPSSVTSIDDDHDNQFCQSFSLKEINVDNDNKNYQSIDGVLFNKGATELLAYPMKKTTEDYEIPNSVTSITGGAFAYCKRLKSITIPDSVTSIGDFAFNLQCEPIFYVKSEKTEQLIHNSNPYKNFSDGFKIIIK